jgi:Ca2+-binding EF-hand superfamily protein
MYMYMQIQELFRLIDVNENGGLDYSEIQHGLESLRTPVGIA